jgi:hypothetical protein
MTDEGLEGTAERTDGVLFTEEASIPGARLLSLVKVELGKGKTVQDVRAELARRTRRLGGDAVVGFRYGQRGNTWSRSPQAGTGGEHWFGEGRAVKLQTDEPEPAEGG